jgi:hypothetical protein
MESIASLRAILRHKTGSDRIDKTAGVSAVWLKPISKIFIKTAPARGGSRFVFGAADNYCGNVDACKNLVGGIFPFLSSWIIH